MTTEKQAHAIARRYPIEARAGWLLACDAPENIAKGRVVYNALSPQGRRRALEYHKYCTTLYTNKKALARVGAGPNHIERLADIVDGYNRNDTGESPDY